MTDQAAVGERIESMRISVVMPSLNSAGYIGAAIASALSQKPPPHEVVVQDGGSTDGTLDILRSFEPAISWRTEPDTGQSQALNRAIQRSTGNVVVWLNADDLLVPGAFSVVTDAFRSRPDADVIFGDFDIVSADGRLLRRFQSSDYSRRRVFLNGSYIFSGAMFITRRVLERVGPFDESLQACMDLDYLLRLHDASWMHVTQTVARFRMNAGAKSSTMRRRFLRESHAVRRRFAAGSRALSVLTPLLTARDAVVLALQPLRHSVAWSRVRGRRRL